MKAQETYRQVLRQVVVVVREASGSLSSPDTRRLLPVDPPGTCALRTRYHCRRKSAREGDGGYSIRTGRSLFPVSQSRTVWNLRPLGYDLGLTIQGSRRHVAGPLESLAWEDMFVVY